MNDFTITKREILVSIIIVLLMLVFGFIIHEKISDSIFDAQQQYNTALQINNDTDLFSYGMRTNVGNVFAYGDLKAIDFVSYDDIDGKYSYIERVKEKYTRHTRIIKTGKTTTTQVYYTWDRVGSESKHSKKISFLDIEFDYDKISFPEKSYIDTIKESSNIRYKYYGVGTEYTGTLYATLENDTIYNTTFYPNYTIEQVLNSKNSNAELVFFWIIWSVIICALVFGFCYIDNKWLED